MGKSVPNRGDLGNDDRRCCMSLHTLLRMTRLALASSLSGSVRLVATQAVACWLAAMAIAARLRRDVAWLGPMLGWANIGPIPARSNGTAAEKRDSRDSSADGADADPELAIFKKHLPRQMRNSMTHDRGTYDRGSEMACHPDLARRLKIDI